MKINKIYISAFGKFKDFTLELSDGFNLVFGENEKGKSTLMAFIKMMFYGTAGKKGQQLSSRPRLKYKPWSNEDMGGRIYFSHAGHNYCLERQFGKSDSTDKIRLTDTDLGVNLPADADIGKSFFGFSIAAFERSVFIEAGAPYVHDDAGEGELNMRLSNLALTGEEDTSYQTVVSRLQDCRYDIISKSGKTGKYPRLTALADTLKEELSKVSSAAQRRREIMEDISKIEKQFKQLKEEYNSYKKIIDLENDFRTKEKIEDYLKTKDSLDDLTGRLALDDGATADESFVKAVEFGLSKVNNLKEKITEKENEIKRKKTAIKLDSEKSTEELEKEAEFLRGKLKENEQAKEQLSAENDAVTDELNSAKENCERMQGKKKKYNPLLLGLGGIAFIAAVITVAGPFNSSVVTAALFVMAIVCEALAFVIRPLDTAAAGKAKSEYDMVFTRSLDIKNRLSALSQEGIEYSSKLSMITASLNSDVAIKNQRLSELKESEDELSVLYRNISDATSNLLTLYRKYEKSESTEDIESGLKTLRQSAGEIKEIKLKLNYLCRDLNGISYEEAREKLSMINTSTLPEGTDFEAAKSKVDELNEAILQLTDYRSGLAAQLKAEFSRLKEPETIKREIAEAQEKAQELKFFNDAALLAEDVLSESFSQVRRGYGATLEQKTLDIFSRLTLKNYNGVSVSKSLDMTVEKTGVFGMKEADYLSSGTYDQAYLSLRLAISALMNEGETLPILLDDVLSLYDDERAAAALEFLNEYSRTTQCILFTCHGNLRDMAQKSNINTISL